MLIRLELRSDSKLNRPFGTYENDVIKLLLIGYYQRL